MSETNLWKRLRDALAPYGFDLHRVENLLEPGMPDVNYCCGAAEGWIELKYSTVPKRSSTRVFGAKGLRKEQILWIERRIRTKGIVWIFAQASQHLVLLDGCHAAGFNEMTLTQLRLSASWYHQGRMPDWAQLVTVMLSRKEKVRC